MTNPWMNIKPLSATSRLWEGKIQHLSSKCLSFYSCYRYLCHKQQIHQNPKSWNYLYKLHSKPDLRHKIHHNPTKLPSSYVRLYRRFSTITTTTRSSSSDSSTSTSRTLWDPTDEHTALRSALRTFVQRHVEPQANHYNKTETFNVDLFRQLGNKNLGVLGLTVDEEYGGSGLADATAVAIVHEELSYSDPAFCLSYLAHSLLFVNNLNVNASPEQKERFLPAACDGTKIGGMCMSEPNAGTDVLGMKTTAIPTRTSTVLSDGTTANENSDWLLNGTKMWITNGTYDGETTGDFFLVYAKSGPGKFDITQFIVEKDMPGFSLGQKIQDKLGMRASMTAELVFDNVIVPSSNVVGGVNQALSCMMRNLVIERIGLAAMAIGIARRSLNEMKNYALTREAFDKRDLLEFGQIQKLVADSYVEYMAGRCYLYNTAQSIGSDLQSTGKGIMDADGTKLFCANMSKQVSDRAIQVLGGNGYVGQYIVERMWRDAKLLEIGGGTNESHHKNISRDIRKMGVGINFE